MRILTCPSEHDQNQRCYFYVDDGVFEYLPGNPDNQNDTLNKVISQLMYYADGDKRRYISRIIPTHNPSEFIVVYDDANERAGANAKSGYVIRNNQAIRLPDANQAAPVINISNAKPIRLTHGSPETLSKNESKNARQATLDEIKKNQAKYLEPHAALSPFPANPPEAPAIPAEEITLQNFMKYGPELDRAFGTEGIIGNLLAAASDIKSEVKNAKKAVKDLAKRATDFTMLELLMEDAHKEELANFLGSEPLETIKATQIATVTEIQTNFDTTFKSQVNDEINQFLFAKVKDINAIRKTEALKKQIIHAMYISAKAYLDQICKENAGQNTRKKAIEVIEKKFAGIIAFRPPLNQAYPVEHAYELGMSKSLRELRALAKDVVKKSDDKTMQLDLAAEQAGETAIVSLKEAIANLPKILTLKIQKISDDLKTSVATTKAKIQESETEIISLTNNALNYHDALIKRDEFDKNHRDLQKTLGSIVAFSQTETDTGAGVASKMGSIKDQIQGLIDRANEINDEISEIQRDLNKSILSMAQQKRATPDGVAAINKINEKLKSTITKANAIRKVFGLYKTSAQILKKIDAIAMTARQKLALADAVPSNFEDLNSPEELEAQTSLLTTVNTAVTSLGPLFSSSQSVIEKPVNASMNGSLAGDRFRDAEAKFSAKLAGIDKEANEIEDTIAKLEANKTEADTKALATVSIILTGQLQKLQAEKIRIEQQKNDYCDLYLAHVMVNAILNLEFWEEQLTINFRGIRVSKDGKDYAVPNSIANLIEIILDSAHQDWQTNPKSAARLLAAIRVYTEDENNKPRGDMPRDFYHLLASHNSMIDKFIATANSANEIAKFNWALPANAAWLSPSTSTNIQVQRKQAQRPRTSVASAQPEAKSQEGFFQRHPIVKRVLQGALIGLVVATVITGIGLLAATSGGVLGGIALAGFGGLVLKFGIGGAIAAAAGLFASIVGVSASVGGLVGAVEMQDMAAQENANKQVANAAAQPVAAREPPAVSQPSSSNDPYNPAEQLPTEEGIFAMDDDKTPVVTIPTPTGPSTQAVVITTLEASDSQYIATRNSRDKGKDRLYPRIDTPPDSGSFAQSSQTTFSPPKEISSATELFKDFDELLLEEIAQAKYPGNDNDNEPARDDFFTENRGKVNAYLSDDRTEIPMIKALIKKVIANNNDFLTLDFSKYHHRELVETCIRELQQQPQPKSR